MKFAILIALFVGVMSQAKAPEWALKDTQQLSGKNFLTTCSGTGPSLETARRDALDSCRRSASQQLASNIEIHSLTIQSENSVGFHEEVSEKAQYEGLVCTPLKDEVEETDGGYRVWIQCRFDLFKVKAIPLENEVPSASSGSSKQLGILSSAPATKQDLHLTDNFALMISVVPKCDSLLIRGKKPRRVICDANPMRVVLDAAIDDEILVRASGFQPKTISIRNEEGNEVLQVLLEKN